MPLPSRCPILRHKDRVRRILGYLPQEFGMYPKVTAEEMLDHFATLKGIHDRRARRGVVEALLLGDDAALDALLATGAEALPSPPPNDGSLLIFARTPFAVERLLALGVSPDAADRWGATPMTAFHRLGPRGRPLVARLNAHGVPVPPADSVMLAAVDGRDREMVVRLLGLGVSPNARATAQSRQTALHNAAWNGDLPMVRLLVEAGADVEARDEEHDATPQVWAETAVEVTRNPDCAAVARYLAGLVRDGRP